MSNIYNSTIHVHVPSLCVLPLSSCISHEKQSTHNDKYHNTLQILVLLFRMMWPLHSSH